MSSSTQVRYEETPAAVADGGTKTPLADEYGRVRVVVDPAADLGAVYETSTASGFEQDATIPEAGPRIADSFYVWTPEALTGAATKRYALVFDLAPGVDPVSGTTKALYTFGPLGADDCDWWEPPSGWEFTNGIKVWMSDTPVLFTTPAIAGNDLSVLVRHKAKVA